MRRVDKPPITAAELAARKAARDEPGVPCAYLGKLLGDVKVACRPSVFAVRAECLHVDRERSTGKPGDCLPEHRGRMNREESQIFQRCDRCRLRS